MLLEFKCPKNEQSAESVFQSSKFIAYVARVNDAVSARDFILSLKKKHPYATHICYAFSFVENLGKTVKTKSSDDKEPAGTAGKPILECIKNNNLNNTIICVVRYFGGTLLGASNLLKAYVQSSQKAIDSAILERMHLSKKCVFDVAYNHLSKIEAFLEKKNIQILDTEFL